MDLRENQTTEGGEGYRDQTTWRPGVGDTVTLTSSDPFHQWGPNGWSRNAFVGAAFVRVDVPLLG